MANTSFGQEFKAFISRGNVVDMAVGIIIGAAFTAIVTSMVSDVIMPPIGVLMGGMDFSNMFLSLDGINYVTLEAAKEAGAPVMAYGLFVNAVIQFLIVALVIFTMVRGINKMKQEQAKEDAKKPAAPAADVVLLSEIRDLLKGGKSATAKPATTKVVAKKAPVKKKAPAKKKVAKKTTKKTAKK